MGADARETSVVGSILQAVLFLGWGVVGLLLCVDCLFALNATSVAPDSVVTRIGVWLLLTLLLLLYLLFFSRTAPRRRSADVDPTALQHDDSKRDQVALRWTLVSTVAIAIPGIVLGVVALVISLPEYLESLNANPETLRVDGFLPEGENENHGYILAIDISRSFLPGPSDNNAPNIRGLREYLETLVSYDGTHLRGRMLKYGDKVKVVYFAETPGDLNRVEATEILAENGEGIARLLGEMGSAARSLEGSQGSPRLRTDLVKVIELLAYEAQTDFWSDVTHVTIIIASDFFHHANSTDENSARQRLKKAMQRIVQSSRVHIVGLVGESYSGDNQGIDIQPDLETFEKGGVWRRVDLSRYDENKISGPSKIVGVALSVFPHEKSSAHVRLKHAASGKADGLECVVDLGAAAGGTVIITSAQSLSNGAEGAQVPLSLRLEGQEEGVTPAKGIVKESFIVDGPLSLNSRILLGLGVSTWAGPRNSLALMIASPEHRLIKSFDLSIVPVHAESIATAITYIVVFFSLLVVLIMVLGITTVFQVR